MSQNEENEQNFLDPFDGGFGTNIALLITQMRVYDALMALLAVQDPDLSDKLNEVHQSGGILGSYPSLTGEDETNE